MKFIALDFIRLYLRLLYSATLILMWSAGKCNGQGGVSRMLRVYEDNDFINIHFSGTDKAYTHGLRLDFFATRNKRNARSGRWWMIASGDSSIITSGWGLMQAMVTPAVLSNTGITPGDYRYACSITAHYSHHTAIPEKKVNLQADYVVGIMGPAALGRQTQAAIHHLINDEPPRGWNTQLKTSVLVNVNVMGERQVMNIGNIVECIAGGKLYLGTARTGLSGYGLLRIGRLGSYFSGYNSQYLSGAGPKCWQLYAVLRPSLDVTFRNALIQGGIIRPERDRVLKENGEWTEIDSVALNRFGAALDYGVVLALERFCITFMQMNLYPMIQSQSRHEVGNISVYIPMKAKH
ncbi:lipid A deacylase LpxR family protein [Chryseolinea sp. T2]|uniref:lipid A deacylase LpxR family protein n=1 Tax=Chryseolinea sp. T2 TaxID=3129255 RepID=UPI003076CAC8